MILIVPLYILRIRAARQINGKYGSMVDRQRFKYAVAVPEVGIVASYDGLLMTAELLLSNQPIQASSSSG